MQASIGSHHSGNGGGNAHEWSDGGAGGDGGGRGDAERRVTGVGEAEWRVREMLNSA
jgi:hypothetical protein